MRLPTLGACAALALVSACAVRLGGPKPEEYRVLALRTDGEAAGAVAERVRAARADVAFIVAPRDSAWFAAVAAVTGHHLSGPARADDLGIAFLAGEALGDTTVILPMESGSELVVQDALYGIDEHRFLDLMAVAVPAEAAPREAARALLAYVATDVMKQAAVVLAIIAENPQTAQEVVTLLEPAFVAETACQEASGPLPGRVRVVHGPALQIRCPRSRLLEGEPAALLAEVVVRR